MRDRHVSFSLLFLDNVKTWTGLSVEESVRITEINGESTSMVWPTLGPRTAKEQIRTDLIIKRLRQIIVR